jgi:4-amino-4-deoxy-L-arabinose transferase-like glycosyltransferase
MLAEPSMSPTWRTASILLALSLGLRLALLWPVLERKVEPQYDERGYFERAKGFSAVYRHLTLGQPPSETAVRRAYGQGKWPPLHPGALGLGLFLFGTSVSAARWVVVLLSAITCPVIFVMASKLASRRAAIIAGLLYAVYPSFLGFSHYLWSEPTYILALLLTVNFALSIRLAETGARKLRASLLCGLFLGSSALARAAALPFLVVIPVWLFLALREPRDRWIHSGVVSLVSVVVLLPWLLTLRAREGSFTTISTANGYNLLLGNSPGDGGDDEVKQAIRRYAREHSVHPDRAARTLAVREILDHPARFVGSCVTHFRELWTIDVFILRHVFHLVYPPFTTAAVWWLLGALLTSYLALLGLACWGALAGGIPAIDRGLILALVVVGMIPPVVSISNTRMGLPLLALLIPLAAHGWDQLRRRRPSGLRAAVIVSVLAANLVNILTLPRIFGWVPLPSSYYLGVVNPIDDLLGSRTPLTDCLRLRASPSQKADRVTVSLIGEEYRFHGSRETELSWQIADGRREVQLDVYSYRAENPLKMEFRSPLGYASLQPVAREHWREWQATGLEGIELLWCGGGRLPPAERGDPI